MLLSKRSYLILGNTAMLLGGLGVLIGFIAIATNIEPEMFKKVIGQALAVSFTTLLYGFLVKIPCYLIEQKIQTRIEQLD